MPYDNLITRDDAAALIPTDISNEILGHVAEDSVVMTLGRRAPDMNTRVRTQPVLASLPTAYFVNGDTGLKQTTEISWDGVQMVAEELAVIVPVPEAVLEDAQYDIFGQMRPLIQEAFGIAFDQAVLYGMNKPASWPTAIVPEAITRGNGVVAGSLGDLYNDIMGVGGVIAKVEEDGFFVNGHVASLGLRAMMRGLRAGGTGAPLLETNVAGPSRYALDGETLAFPRNGALDPATSLMISGDWTQLVWAMRKDITYRVITEGVIQDNTGAIVLNLAQQDSIALRCVMRVAYARPVILNRIGGTAAQRFPFAILRPTV